MVPLLIKTQIFSEGLEVFFCKIVYIIYSVCILGIYIRFKPNELLDKFLIIFSCVLNIQHTLVSSFLTPFLS